VRGTHGAARAEADEEEEVMQTKIEKLLAAFPGGVVGIGASQAFVVDCAGQPVVSAPRPKVPTLRDRFAMAALTGICASDVFAAGAERQARAGKRDVLTATVLSAFELADAMMEARK
jgi:hypothetical protein